MAAGSGVHGSHHGASFGALALVQRSAESTVTGPLPASYTVANSGKAQVKVLGHAWWVQQPCSKGFVT